MNRNLMLVLFVFFSLMFSSCSSTVRTFNHIPDEYLGSEYSSELGQVWSRVELFLFEKRYNFLHGHLLPQSDFPLKYENYLIWISITDQPPKYSYSNEDTMLHMYIDECRIILPSGNVIDLMNNNITINYSYTRLDFSQKAPPQRKQNVQPQHTEDGKKVFYLDSVVDRDVARIEFNEKIPSSAQTLRMEYALTVVWENLGEVKSHHNLLFKKKTHKAFLLTV